MQPLQIAIATAGLTNSLREAIVLAGQSGAEGVQLDVRSEASAPEFGETASRQLLHAFAERGLKIASTTFPLRRALHDPLALDGRIEAIRDAMRLSSRLKCRVLTLRIGRIPDESQSEDVERLVDALNDLARTGNHLGITPAITASVDSPQRLATLLESVTEGPVGIDLDPAGCISAQLDPLVMLKSISGSLVHLQARDAVRDVEIGGKEVPLGRGETAWDELLATLADTPFAGWVTVRRTTGDDRIGDTVRGVAYLKNVTGGA